jgi:hypothetical protein
MGRWILPLLLALAAAPAFGALHPGVRPVLAGLLRRGDPDEQYRLAERSYQAWDLEKAEELCVRALRRRPDHVPSRALLRELRFVLGRPDVRATLSLPGNSLLRLPFPSGTLEGLREMETAHARGHAALRQGDRVEAERELRRVLELARRLPTGIEAETCRRTAEESLARLGGDGPRR